MDLYWSEVGSATYYQLSYSPVQSNDEVVFNVSSTNVTVSELIPGYLYTFYLQSFGPGGASNKSNCSYSTRKFAVYVLYLFVGAAFNKCQVIHYVPVYNPAILDVYIPPWFTLHHISVLDPEISEGLTVTETTQQSVSLTWSIGNTQHIDMIQLYQREIDESASAAAPWLPPTNTSSTSSHTVTSLRPGTKYQFYMQIQSYGKTAITDSIYVTAGETRLGYFSITQQLVVTKLYVYTSQRQ